MCPVGDELPARFWPAVVSRKVGAGRARIRHNNSIIRQGILQSGNDAFGFDRRVVAGGQRSKSFQFSLPCTGGAGSTIKVFRQFAVLTLFQQGCERAFGIRRYGNFVG